MVITSLSQLDLNGTYSYADYLKWRFDESVELIKDLTEVFENYTKQEND